MDAALKQYEEAQAKRPIYVFDLPPSAVELQDQYIKKSVGLVKLTMREELDALDRAGRNAAKAGYYMLETALVEVDGRPVSRADAEQERILNNTDPAIRTLLVAAHTDLSGSSADDETLFLKSRKVKVG